MKRAAVVLALVASMGCASLKPGPTLTTPGQIAFYADRVMMAIGALQDFVIAGEKAGAISTDDTRKVIAATKIAGQAGVDLAKALKAGADAVGARNAAIAVIKSALQNIPSQLSQPTQKQIQPYVDGVLVLLSLWAGNAPLDIPTADWSAIAGRAA